MDNIMLMLTLGENMKYQVVSLGKNWNDNIKKAITIKSLKELSI